MLPGANRHQEAGESLPHGVLGGGILAAVLAGGLLILLAFLDQFGQPEAVVALSPGYLVWLAWAWAGGMYYARNDCLLACRCAGGRRWGRRVC